MRTTVRLPDELYDDVRRLAITEGVTVTSVIEEALRAVLHDRARVREHVFVAEPYRPAVAGTLPGVDLDDSAALLDLLDGIR